MELSVAWARKVARTIGRMRGCATLRYRRPWRPLLRRGGALVKRRGQAGDLIGAVQHFEAAAVEIVVEALALAAEMLGEELLRDRHERKPVLRPHEAVAFVGVEQIDHLLAVALHRLGELVGFRPGDTHVVRGLRQQPRPPDATAEA